MLLAAYVARRLLQLFVALVGVSIVAFLITRVLPGNPVYLMVGTHANQATVDAATVRLGLDRPLLEQYVLYLRGVASGDFGVSWRTGSQVGSELWTRLPATIELATFAMLLAMLWSLVLGLLAAANPGSLWDRFVTLVSGLGVSIPEFVLGILFLLIFYSWLGWAPPPLGRIVGAAGAPTYVTGLYTVDAVLSRDWAALQAAIHSLILPAGTLALVVGAPLVRVTRAFLSDVFQSQYVRAAEARGIRRGSILLRHALPNALLPVTTMLAMLYGYLLGGTVLVEVVFAWPGIGKYAVDSIASSDYAPVMAAAQLGAFTYLMVYMIVDLFQFLVDPRARS